MQDISQEDRQRAANSTFIIITGPGDCCAFAKTFNRPAYNCPEAFKWDRDVAVNTKEIIEEGNRCTIVTQSEIVVHQFLIALKKNKLKVEDISFYFIRRPDLQTDDSSPLIERLELAQKGRILRPCSELFQQLSDDLTELL